MLQFGVESNAAFFDVPIKRFMKNFEQTIKQWEEMGYTLHENGIQISSYSSGFFRRKTHVSCLMQFIKKEN